MNIFLFYNKFILFLNMYRALCAHHQEVNLYYTASGIVTLCRWPSGAQVMREDWLEFQPVLSQPVHRTVTYKFDDTRCCIIQVSLLMMSTVVLETCRGI